MTPGNSPEANLPTNTPKVLIEVRAELGDDVWDVDIKLNGKPAGGGTTPAYPIDLAAEILYGSKNDWLNESYGVLGNHLKSIGRSVR